MRKGSSISLFLLLCIFVVLSFMTTKLYSQDTILLLNGKKFISNNIKYTDENIEYRIPDEQYDLEKIKADKMNKWSFGINFGTTLQHSDFFKYSTDIVDKYIKSARFGYSFDLSYNVSRFFRLQAQYNNGMLYGEKSVRINNFDGIFFETTLNQYSLNYVFNLSRIFSKQEHKLNIYAKAGTALLGFRSVERHLDLDSLPENKTFDYINGYGYLNAGAQIDKSVYVFTIPIGLNINYSLNKRLDVRFESTLNIVSTKQLDVESAHKGNDKYSFTSLGFSYKLGRVDVPFQKTVDKSEVFGVIDNKNKKQIFSIDTTSNYYLTKALIGNKLLKIVNQNIYNEIVNKTRDYIAGEEYAIQHYKPVISTTGSVLTGLCGGYLAFWGFTLPTFYTIVVGSSSPDIVDAKNNPQIPQSKLNDKYFIQGYKDKARKKEVRNAIVGGLSGFVAMIIVKSIHFGLTNK